MSTYDYADTSLDGIKRAIGRAEYVTELFVYNVEAVSDRMRELTERGANWQAHKIAARMFLRARLGDRAWNVRFTGDTYDERIRRADDWHYRAQSFYGHETVMTALGYFLDLAHAGIWIADERGDTLRTLGDAVNLALTCADWEAVRRYYREGAGGAAGEFLAIGGLPLDMAH